MDTVNFSEQVEMIVEALAESQKKTWEGWWTAFPTLASAQPSAPAADVGAQGPGAATLLAEGMSAGTSALLGLLRLSASTWQSLTAALGDETAWADLPGFESVNGLQQRFRFPAVGSTQDVVELWRLSLEELHKLQRAELQKLSRPWFDLLGEAGKQIDGATGDDDSVLGRFSDLYWDTFERTMGRLIQSPNVGYTREFDERFLRSSSAWIEFRSASFDYLVVLGDAWRKALVEFSGELASLSGRGTTITSLKDLLALWTEVADRVMIETFGNERYARAQGRLLNAAMAYRLEEQEAVEALLKMSHMPTRSEVDALGREIVELRRQLRAVTKKLEAGSRVQPASERPAVEKPPAQAAEKPRAQAAEKSPAKPRDQAAVEKPPAKAEAEAEAEKKRPAKRAPKKP